MDCTQRVHMRLTTLTFGIGVFLAASTASAQSLDPYASTFSGNYDFVYHELQDTSNLGAHFDVATTVKHDMPFLAVAGEVGVNHFTGATVSSYLGGARLRFPNFSPSVLPFAQFLGGLYHCGACSVSDFAIQGGGGLDFKVSDSNDLRIRAQIDVRHMFDSVQGFTAVRVSAGVVLPLNR